MPPLVMPWRRESLVGLHQHVENRIADPENVVFRFSH
jgi:hypothetical protein